MRYKIVPEPRSLEFLAEAQRAVPLVPGSVEDCCIRMVDRTAIPSRDAAREYLTFLEALELVEETSRGYERRRVAVEREHLADAFERRVFGAAELLDALDVDGPLTSEATFDSLREAVPRWERDRHTDWEREWRERIERLLDWAVVFGLVETTDGEYRLADSE